MFFQVFIFEIKYRLKRPATYAYFFILFFMAFLAVYSNHVGIGGEGGLVNKNSPYTINTVVLIMVIFGTLICSAIMGVPVFRDFEHGFHEIIFTTPIKKSAYLAGRFFGSYLIALFVFSGLLWGNMIGSVFPGVETAHIGPFMPYAYLNPFLIYIVPNTLILGALFFAMGSYFRNQLAIYVQGVVLFVLYLIILSNQRDVEHSRIMSILDPFGFSATLNLTRYWTPAEKNLLTIPLTGFLLYNRLLWMGIAIVISFVFYTLFKFSKAAPRLTRKKATESLENVPEYTEVRPTINYSTGFVSHLKQWWMLVKFDFKSVIKAIPFIVITLCGVFLLLSLSSSIGSAYGTETYPVTYMILDLLTGNFMLFLIIIITFYSGELLWKEINVKLAPIIDATPLSNYIILTSKFTAMIFVELVLLVILLVSGVLLQTINGFYDYQIPIYLKSILLNTFPYLLLITLLTFFVHSLVNNKFLGHVIVILFWVANFFLAANDIDHNLLMYARTPNASYSAMNGFGHFVFPILVFNAYWLMIGVVFFMISLLMMKRGSELGFAQRFTKMKSLWKAGHGKLIIPLFLLLFVLFGGFIYYNTNILNTYQSPKEQRKLSAAYENKYHKYANKIQPRITAIKAYVDIFPYQRSCKMAGTYVLTNKSSQPIDSIIIMLPTEAEIKTMKFGLEAKNVLEDKEQGFYIYYLSKPLAALDSTTLSFDLNYSATGFTNDGGSTSVIYNGTFINNGLMPQIGYSEVQELTDDDRRKEEGLPKKLYRMNPITDTTALQNTYLSQDADWVTYEAIVSTSPDQIAISPGYLQKEWTEKGRRYFHYKMDSPIWNFVSFLSARYEVLRESYQGVNIEIYYQKGHEYNLKRMINGIKRTLDYCNANFSAYQHKQVRIIEFPRYQLFAQSFPNTIPFSEGIGFIMDVDKESDIDMAFYVTSHEVGHQWWGHQVCGGNVQGATMMVESMAQYTALMVMEQEYGRNNMEKFLKYELDRYLRGRAGERKKELPLMLNENQQYIHYQKGSLVFYALKDYIGEDSLNAAFARFVKDYAFKDGPYPTSIDFVSYIKQVTPDSLKYIITDLCETITLFNNKTNILSYTKNTNNQYKTILEVESHKFRADSIGNEKVIPLNDWIDIGIYTALENGKDSLFFLEKRRMTKGINKFEIRVPLKPSKAGIDPLHKLIDRNSGDNTKSASEI